LVGAHPLRCVAGELGDVVHEQWKRLHRVEDVRLDVVIDFARLVRARVRQRKRSAACMGIVLPIRSRQLVEIDLLAVGRPLPGHEAFPSSSLLP